MQDAAGPHATPSEVTAEGGCVLVNGPGGIAISMTPEAAAETSDRMLVASTMAAGQRTFARMYKPSDGG